MAGYSKKPLVAKLGIKPDDRLYILDAPDNYYEETLGPLPPGATLAERGAGSLDFVQLFVKRRADLERGLAALKTTIYPAGMLWVSWPKGRSKIETDLNGNIVRDIGLAHGLVDVKVCAVDNDWSGLKFVYRLKDRK